MPTEYPLPRNILSLSGDLDLNAPETELRFADGRLVRVPTALLRQQDVAAPEADSLPADDSLVIPLIEEQLQVGRRIVETGRVHLHKSSEAFEVTLDKPLAVSTWKVERVPRNEIVAEPPAPRQEGSTTIYPLVQERLVVLKELVLTEEIYVTQELSERRDTRTVTLRRETLNVDREAVSQS